MNSKLSNFINEKIKSGKIKMKSKSFFVAENFFLVLLAAILVIAFLAFVNFTFYIMSKNGSLQFLEFGPSGLKAFLENIPYPVIIWAVMLVAAACLIYRNFDLSYRKPKYFLLVFFAVLVLGLVFGFFALRMNDRFRENAERLGIPLVKNAYRFVQPDKPDNNYGLLAKIVSVKPKYVVAQISGGKTLIFARKNDAEMISEVEIKPYEIQSKLNPRFGDQYFAEVYEEMLAHHQALMIYLDDLQFQTGQVIKLVGVKIGDRFYPEKILPAQEKFYY